MRPLDAYRAAVDASGYRDEHAPLFIAAWEELEAAYLARLQAGVDRRAEWRERLRAGAELTAELVEAHPREARFLAVEPLAVGPLGRARQRDLGIRLAALLDSVREELDSSRRVPPATAHWIVSIFFDRIYKRCATGAGPDLRSQLPQLLFLANTAYFGTEAGFTEFLRGP